MANIQSVQMLNNALQNASESGLRNRALQQQQEAEMARIAMQQQMEQVAQSRWDAQTAHNNAMEKIGMGRNSVADKNADTNAAKVASKSNVDDSTANLNNSKADAIGKKLWYVTGPDHSSHEVYGNFSDAQAIQKQQQSQNPDTNFQILDKPDENTEKTVMADGTVTYLSPTAKANYEAHMAEANRPSRMPAQGDTVTTETPANPGSPAIPASGGILGFGATSGTPAVPPTPKTTIVSHRPGALSYPAPPLPPSVPAADGSQPPLPATGLPGNPPAPPAAGAASQPPAAPPMPKRQPWDAPPQLNYNPTNTPPEMASLLDEANKFLKANPDKYQAVTNRLATQYGITFGK